MAKSSPTVTQSAPAPSDATAPKSGSLAVLTEPAAPLQTLSLFASPAENLESFLASDGEGFGGSYPRLELEQGHVSCLLRATNKKTKVHLPAQEGKEPEIVNTPLAVAILPDKREITISLPIGAVFQKTYKEANFNVGDTFKVARFQDATKKKGLGTGQKMQVYGIKIEKRSPVTTSATPAA